MYTLSVAAAVAAVVFLAVAAVFQPIAALVPAVLAFGLTGWFVLRRVSRLVEAEVAQLVPMLQARQIAEAQGHLVRIKQRWSRWMPLLEGQMEAQIGILD